MRLLALLALTVVPDAAAYNLAQDRLPQTNKINIVFHLGGAGNSVAQQAVAKWNYLLNGSTKVGFSTSNTTGNLYGNGVNDVSISNSYEGGPFPTGVVAMQHIHGSGASVTEIDVVFNKQMLDMTGYYGMPAALQAIGGIIGLESPWTAGQVVDSVMNDIGSVPDIQYDDNLGIVALFGGHVLMNPDGSLIAQTAALHALRLKLKKLQRKLLRAQRIQNSSVRAAKEHRLKRQIRAVRGQIKAASA